MKENHTLLQGWQPYGTRAQNCTRKNILGTWHSLLFQFIFSCFCLISVSNCDEYVYIYTYD
jgi:hypothetical protein